MRQAQWNLRRLSIVYCTSRVNSHTSSAHHHKLFGFSFSQHTCPRETELVVSLFKALLLQGFSYVLGPTVEPKVSILCHKTHDQISHCILCLQDGWDWEKMGHRLSQRPKPHSIFAKARVGTNKSMENSHHPLLSYLICLGSSWVIPSTNPQSYRGLQVYIAVPSGEASWANRHSIYLSLLTP